MSVSTRLKSATPAELRSELQMKAEEAYQAYRTAKRVGNFESSNEAWQKYGQLEDAAIRLDTAVTSVMDLLDSES
jgi:hypothetical protein